MTPVPFRNELHYDSSVFERVDWSYRGTYMHKKHGITPEVANDALGDADRVMIDPDYNSTSGRSARIVEFSVIAQEIITVIVLKQGGVEHGVNGWVANDKDRRLYDERGEGGTDGQED